MLDGLVARGLASVEPAGRPGTRPPRRRRRSGCSSRASRDARAARARGRRGGRAADARLPRRARSEDDPLSYIELLREPAAIGERFAELEAAAEREILVFTKPPYAVQPAENVAGLQLLERGVEARSVYER